MLLLVLPAVGIVLTYVLLCRQLGTVLAIAQCRGVVASGTAQPPRS